MPAWGAWVIFIILCILSCGKDQHQAENPTFISVATAKFKTEPGQGTDHQLISEIWIYVDSQFIGAYPVPSIFPVLGDGMLNLDVFAGIRENAQALSPVIYPLIKPLQLRVGAAPGQEVSLNPEFSYHDRTTIAFNEDFEASNIFGKDLDGDTATYFNRSGTNAIDGISAEAILSAIHPVVEVATIRAYPDLPVNGLPVFLEMEYKADMALAVGIRATDNTPSYKLLLFPSTEIKKIYINFTSEVQSVQAGAYEIIFRASFDSDLAKQFQEVTIDNIKLLHFRP